MGYKCRKARLKYGGREWTAWYPPPDLPISSGSWKFHGLPGLILKADDTTGMHRFEAYLLLKGKGLTINEVSDAGGDIKTTRDKFIVHRNKMKLDERNMTSLIITMTPERSFSCAPGNSMRSTGITLKLTMCVIPYRVCPCGGAWALMRSTIFNRWN